MVDRSDPFAEFERILEQLNQSTGDFMHGEEPPVDLLEYSDAFEVIMDVPGIEKDDVDLRLAGQTLILRADRDRDIAEDATYRRRERPRGPIERSVDLPEDVTEDEVTARLADGELHVTLPRASVEEAHDIDIE